jgi:hypothetical protein
MSVVAVESILRILSPGRMPALKAGVPSMGVITVSWLSLSPSSMPRPPKDPVVLICISL